MKGSYRRISWCALSMPNRPRMEKPRVSPNQYLVNVGRPLNH